MTIVFPRPMPLSFAGAEEFEIQRVDYMSPEAGGRISGVQAGFPKWIATWTMATLSRQKSDEMRAFVASLRGSQRRFVGYEVGRELPRYHVDGIPFTQSPSSWSQAIGDDGSAYLTLNGLLPGMVLSPGDYIGFVWSGWKRALVRSLEQGLAGAGGSVTVAIEPTVPSLVPDTATTTLVNPGCLMKATSETSLGTLGRRMAISGGKIVAAQDLVP